MTLKEYWSKARHKTTGWFREHKVPAFANYHPQINDDGLISEETEPAAETVTEESGETGGNQVVVKTVPPTARQESLEKLQDGFNKLVEQLQGINKHLNQQATQHQELMGRIEQLPQLLESFPTVLENQKQITEQLMEQLKSAALKDQQFIDAVEKIPGETAKQTDALVEVNHQLAAAADTDVQMNENLNTFNKTLDKLNETSTGQTDSIMQMSKTFATSDRYLKYLMSRQNKRFMWIFITAVGVCVLAVLILAGIIIYLSQR